VIIKETIEKPPSLLEKIAPKQVQQVQQAVKAVREDVKQLVLKSSAVDVSLGVLIGAAVTPLVKSLVNDIVVPPSALFFGRELKNLHWVLRDGPSPDSYATVEEAEDDGAVIIKYGSFAQSIINCVIILGVTYGIIRVLRGIRAEGGFVKYVQKTRSDAELAIGRLLGKVHAKSAPAKAVPAES